MPLPRSICRLHPDSQVQGITHKRSPVVEKVQPQSLRHREHPLAVRNRRQHLSGQPLRPHHCALGVARRAEPTPLARQRHTKLPPAGVAPHPREAALLDAAVQKGEQGALEDSPPGTVALGEALVVHLLEGLVVRLGQPVQGRVPRPVRAIRARNVAGGAGHAGRWSKGRAIPMPARLSPQAGNNLSMLLPAATLVTGTERSPPSAPRLSPAYVDASRAKRPFCRPAWKASTDARGQSFPVRTFRTLQVFYCE